MTDPSSPPSPTAGPVKLGTVREDLADLGILLVLVLCAAAIILATVWLIGVLGELAPPTGD